MYSNSDKEHTMVSKHSNTKRALRVPREIVAALTHTIVSENLGTVDEQDSLDNSQSPQAVNLSTCSPAQSLAKDSSAQFTAQDNIAHYLEEENEKLSSAQRIARSSHWMTLNKECARLAAAHSPVQAATPPCNSPCAAVVSSS